MQRESCEIRRRRGIFVWRLAPVLVLVAIIAAVIYREYRARACQIPPTRALEALHVVDVAQDIYHDSVGTYASSLSELRRQRLVGKEADIEKVEIVSGSRMSWAAKVRSGMISGKDDICAIFVGVRPAWIPPDVPEGNQRCFRRFK